MDNGSKMILGKPLINGKYNESSSNNNSFLNSRSSVIASRGDRELTYNGDGHLITIAPTGAGKGRSVIIPNLLTYKGSVIVIDTKGENYNVTARSRREMGNMIIKLDPFSIINDYPSDSLNPFDILKLPNIVINDEIRNVVELLFTEDSVLKDPFFDVWAKSLIAAISIHIAKSKAESLKSFSEVRSFLYNDNSIYKLAKLLDDEGENMDEEAFQEIAAFLQMNDVTRSGVLARAQQYLRLFGGDSIKQTTSSMSTTSFDLLKILEDDDKPISIYIIIPPSKLNSHKSLLRLWIGTLLTVITNRKKIPKNKTLLLIDEAAQLGNMQLLITAITLMRGYGLSVWTFWQDLSQIKNIYSLYWETIINNCSVIQLFGAKNFRVANDFSEILGARIEDLREIAKDEQILVIDSEGPLLSKRFDYLKDETFKTKFDFNPLYRK